MSDNKSSNGGSGIGFLGTLFLIFMTLKLTHVIDWSWWIVSMPLWIPLACILAILVISGIVIVFITVFTQRWHKK